MSDRALWRKIFLWLILGVLYNATVWTQQDTNEQRIEEERIVVEKFAGYVMQDLRHSVLNEKDNVQDDIPIAFATVVIQELNQVEFSDDEGYFQFTEIESAVYTLSILADGFAETIIEVTIVPEINNEAIYRLRILEAYIKTHANEENDAVDAWTAKLGIERNYTSNELREAVLLNEDPIAIVVQEPGILYESELYRNRNVPNTSGQLYTLSREFTHFGSDQAWNRFFYKNIPIPSNVHISNSNTSIITTRSINSITSYKGMSPTKYGTGLGLTIALSPKINKGNEVVVYANITDPAVSFNYEFTDKLSINITARQSITNWTTRPITNYVITQLDTQDGEVEETNYGDAALSLRYAPDGHDIQLTALGYYDNFVADISNNSTTGEYTSASIKWRENPMFAALGLSWETMVADTGKNVFSTSYSQYSNTSDMQFDFNGDASMAKYNYKGQINTVDLRTSNNYQWFINENNTLNFGLAHDFIKMEGTHSDDLTLENDLRGIALKRQNSELAYLQHINKLYGYTEYLFAHNKREVSFTIGLTQLLSTKSSQKLADDYNNNETEDVSGVLEEVFYGEYASLFPSAKVVAQTPIGNKGTFSIALSYSPTFLHSAKFIDRILTEKSNDYSSESTFHSPVYGLSTLPRLDFQINKQNTLFTETFFSYYYNFSGMFPSLSTGDVDNKDNKVIFITPIRGISVGETIGWNWILFNHRTNLSYTYALSLYETEVYGWIPPADDTRHQIKLSYFYTRLRGFQLGLVGIFYIDRPFTPIELTENTDSSTNTNTPWIKTYGTPFSERNYVPSYSLVANIGGAIFERENVSLNYRLQTGNLLSFVIVNQEDKVLNQYEGASNKNLDNRKYSVAYDYTDIVNNLYATLLLRIHW